MTDVRAESIAFREALLKSERLRIRTVLGVVGATFLLRTLRAAVVGGDENISSWLMVCGLLAFLASYEWLMLRAVNRTIRDRDELADWVWLGNSIWRPAFLLLRRLSVERIH